MRLLHSIAAAALAACCLPAWAQASVTIPALQGSGLVSPLAGQRVTTEGVVTHVVNNGFFLQDPVGDGDPATSDGVFVFTSSAPTVNGSWRPAAVRRSVRRPMISGSTGP